MATTSARDTPPLRRGVLRAESRSVLATFRMLTHRELAQPHAWVGAHARFADGTTSTVFRETSASGGTAERPALLVVGFRLRVIGRRPWPPMRPSARDLS